MTTIINGSSPSITFSDSTTQTTAFTGSASQITSGTLPSAQLPTGSVLQVVNATYATLTSTTSASWVTTGLSATITPKFATSKIVIICTTSAQNNSTSYACNWTIFRGTVAGTNLGNSSGMCQLYGNSSAIRTTVALNSYDSPATTSAQTYTMAFNSDAVGNTAVAQSNNTVASMTLMEVAG